MLQLEAIDDIYDSWNPDSNTWNPNTTYVCETFTDCTVYFDLEEAWDAAANLEAVRPTPQGICLLSDFTTHKFLDFIGNENGEEPTSKE